MFKNYFKIAFRNLLRHKTFSFINITGLTVGMACCLYILMYVMEQYNYDRHHQDLDSLYRVVTDVPGQNETWHTARLSPPIAPAIAQDFPEVESWTRVVDPPDVSHHVITWNNNSFYETKGYYVDSTFFELFTYAWLEGDPNTALDEPYTVVLTWPVAEKLFGRQSAVGETIRINNRFGDNEFKVTGVVDASQHHSHIRANFYMTMNSGGLGEWIRTNNHWAGNNFISGYVKLKPNADAGGLESKLPAFVDRHGADQLKELGMEKVLLLEPVQDIHLYSERLNQLDTTVSARFLYILLTIAGFIQLIACINFMNLTTARSTKRAKEVGIRKTIGATRAALVHQFLGESMLLALVAVLVAVPLVELALPYLNQLTGSEISTSFSEHPVIWLSLVGLVLLTGLLAGSYPAFYLSAFNAVKVLKGNFVSGISVVGLRKGLVVFQFTISVCLVLGAIIISKQLSYMQKMDLGFQKEQKIIIPFRTEKSREQLAAFKNEVLKHPDVASASGTRVCPGQPVLSDLSFYTEGNDMNSAELMHILRTDEHYLETLQIPLLAGRNFNPSDSTNLLILNERALKNLNIPIEEAVGRMLYSDWQGERLNYQVIGVMRDYHFRPLHAELSPLTLQYLPSSDLFYTLIDAKTGNYSQLLPALEKTWNALVPDVPFEYTFLDENLQQQYKAESNLADIIKSFTLVAILISCLGLFGLSAFTAEQKTKEIGIRKVLGATTRNLVGLLSRDFLRLVLLAVLLAAPIGWYAMNHWLEDFAYRTNVPWWIFAMAGIIALAVASLTVSFQSIKAAMANPVKSLRSE